MCLFLISGEEDGMSLQIFLPRSENSHSSVQQVRTELSKFWYSSASRAIDLQPLWE